MRLLLFPFSFLYFLVTAIRNGMYTMGLLPSKKFDLAVISVGNLSTGGTGKTPHIVYLLNLLQEKGLVATLSRGYGRKTRGYKVANYSSLAEDLGDEPMLFFHRFKNKIIVAVCENRVKGILNLIEDFNPQMILLDDAYQHRKIQPSFSILLTEFHQLYKDDWILPMGNLREAAFGAKRADIIVVTKCPEELRADEKEKLIEKMKPKANQKVFFSTIIYSQVLIGIHREIPIKEAQELNVLLVTGIAKSNKFEAFVEVNFQSNTHLEYKDHHNFTMNDILTIEKAYKKLAEPKIILTTEKDFMRLKEENALLAYLFYCPINIRFDESSVFDEMILNHVITSI